MLGRLIGLVLSLAVWGSSGYLAGKLLQGRGYGLLGNIVLGIVGGFVGSLLVTLFGITGLVKLPFIGGILVGALGSAVVVVAAGLLGGADGGE
ncbi:MAG: GlsB/YeaQ/YmgE family stress response membrane protein [Anaerolineae bacterium]|nr:GlsB/YeaQ/YmgE family stress response membrane protein [Anaerolineae bacterium]